MRVVLAGCGGISRGWRSAVASEEDVEFAGFVDVSIDAAKAASEEDGGRVPVGTDLDAMLSDVTPDVVFDCSVPEAHVDVTLTALKHGCHVLGEKPMADTMANAHRMVDAAKEAGRIYAVMQNRRYTDSIRRVKAFLGHGGIGRVHTLHCDFFIGAHFGGFRDDMEHVLLLDMAIHTFDAARFLSGADPKSVLCHEWNPPGSWYRHGASATAIFEMSNDVVYSYRGSWCAEGRNTSWESDWRIIGDQGSLTWDGGTNATAERPAGSGKLVHSVEPIDVPALPDGGGAQGHAGAIADMLSCIREGREPQTICTDNIRSLAMVHAAIESAEASRRVSIAL